MRFFFFFCREEEIGCTYLFMLPAKVHFGKSQSNRRSVSKKKENEKTEDEKTSGIFLSSQYVDGADRLLWLIYRLQLTAGSL